jgi:hypothetical protein
MSEQQSENGHVDIGGDEAWQQLCAAVANYYSVEPDALSGLVLAVEYVHPNGLLTLASCWSSAVPVWRLEAFARELLKQISRSLREGVTDET